MVTNLEFSVAGEASLLKAFAAMYIARRYDRSRVQRVQDADVPRGAVTISVANGRWMLLTGTPNGERQMIEALSGGAGAVLSMETTTEEFDRALDAVVTGEETYVPARLMRQMATASLQRGAQFVERVPRLSPRQLQVLDLLVEGYENAEIARELVLSVNTVRSHLNTIAVKLGTSNRARIISRAFDLGLVEQRGMQGGMQESHPSTGRRDGVTGGGAAPGQGRACFALSSPSAASL